MLMEINGVNLKERLNPKCDETEGKLLITAFFAIIGCCCMWRQENFAESLVIFFLNTFVFVISLTCCCDILMDSLTFCLDQMVEEMDILASF